MSIELPILSIAPDFAERPTVGPTATMDIMDGMAPAVYGVWPEPCRTVLAAQYRTVTRAEQAALERVFCEVKGMAGILYAPSWHPEFHITGALESGQWSVRIAGTTYGEDCLTGDRWSTLGRYVWIYRHSDGALFGTKVLSATLEDDEQRLHLDDPLPWAGPAKDFAGGFLYLARWNDDTLRCDCWRPGHARYSITLRQTFGRPINAIYEVDGVDQYGFLRLESQWIEPIDFTRTSRKINPTVGPEILRVQQDSVFTDPWVAWVSNNGIRLMKAATVMPPSDEAGVASLFYQTPIVPQHLSLAFDQDAFECLAIQLDDDTIEVKRWQNSQETTHQFSGWSPVLWYDGILQVDTTLRDVVCLYLDKPDSYNLKARFQRDNFSIEYAIATLERRVWFLTDAATLNDRLFLHGITTDGNVTSIYSIDYPPAPVEAQETLGVGIAALSGELTGGIVTTNQQDSVLAGIVSMDGDYVPQVVSMDQQDPAVQVGIMSLDGETYLQAIQTAQQDLAMFVGIEILDGEQVQIVLTIERDETLLASITAQDGTYETG